MNQEKTKTYYLSWIHPQTSKRINAGVAFYDEKYCEFRVKIDSLVGRKLYLKAIKTDNESVIYRIDEVVKIKDKNVRISQGWGLRDSDKTMGHIHFEIAPHLGQTLELVIK